MTALGKAPSTSRNRTDTTFFLCHMALTVSVRRWRESVVVLPRRPPKCVAGRRPCISTMWENSSVTMEVASLASELRSAMGLYALGMLYQGLPGLRNTQVIISFHWPKKAWYLNIARKMWTR